ncbi:CBO0543 family protein [Pontibacillus yanchengensis]|uniref:CBO0543 family protein n=1 Tax=Pontibacillus yanchengensis TaxID=462910 RepID=UPI003C6E6C03
MKHPRKDWVLIFFMKCFISSLVDKITVSCGWIEYPVRLFPRFLKISVLFDYLLFPLLCVWFNQTSYTSNMKSILLQAFWIYSLPVTIFETWLERKTDLIRYKRWSWFHSLTSLAATFLLVRGIMGLIRRDSQISSCGSSD